MAAAPFVYRWDDRWSRGAGAHAHGCPLVAVAPRGCEAEGGLRVITCPDCHAENETGTESCRSCGRALPQVEMANAPLPPWLQQLKPEEDALPKPTALKAAPAPAAAPPPPAAGAPKARKVGYV